MIYKRFFTFFLMLIVLFSSFTPYFATPFSPRIAYAANSCQASGSPQSQLGARVGGVALDQAATFLSDMTDIVGAYYDATDDRIVFVGKKNTSLPKFDKDDLAVAIRAVMFNNTIPAVSIESDPANPDGPDKKVYFFGQIENTNFGHVLFDADVKLKKYVGGYDYNQQPITSSVPGYKSLPNRYMDKGPNPGYTTSSSRFWITPNLVSLKMDTAAQSFVFDQVVMQVNTEPLNPNNDPKWNEAMNEFVQHHTQHYDEFAQETEAYAKTKQLGKIVAVIKWLADNRVASDFQWARDYTPKFVQTPTTFPKIVAPDITRDGYTFSSSGGVGFLAGNTYKADNGTSQALKNASEGVNAPKEDMHWTFVKDGQTYDSVGVAADAFRSLGSYSTSTTDMSFPMSGDLGLGFQRSYSSFSGGQEGVGRGWSFLPARLVDNKPVAGGFLTSSCAGTSYKHRYKLAFQANGQRESFTYNCANGGAYVPDESIFHTTITDAAPSSTEVLYTVTLKDQTQYLFQELYNDPQSTTTYYLRLLEVRDKNGNKITYTYDTADKSKLQSVTDGKGHTITLNYNARNLIAFITDWTGRKVSYDYDIQGNLTSVTDPNSNTTTYTYDNNFKLATIIDREGKKVIENTYTPEAKLATQTDVGNISTSYSYDETLKTVNIADNLGRTEQAKYDDKARILEQKDPLNQKVLYTYGAEYAPLSVTDKRNNKTSYTYDTKGNLATITYPNLKKITYEYDVKNRITRILDGRYGSSPKETKFAYDSANNLVQKNEATTLTSYTYDTYGEMLSLKDHLNRVTSWTRDTFGNPLTQIHPNSSTITYEYDLLGRLKKQTDPESKAENYTYDSNGNLLTLANAVGTTTNIYDKENRLKQSVLPNNTVWEYAYNNAGSLVSVKDAMSSTTSYGYDAYQNLVSQQNALSQTTSHQYDVLDRRTQVTTPGGKITRLEYDANGNISKQTDANGKLTTYDYDNLNRLTKITYADTTIVTHTYDDRGNLVKMIDSVGTTTYTYDIFDRLLSVKNPYGKDVVYTYDTVNNLTKLKYPDSREVAYTYDENNRLTKAVDWNGSASQYTYYKNNLVATKTLPNGVISAYEYDSTNRLLSVSHAKGGNVLAKFTYLRDKVGNIIKVDEYGTFFSNPVPITPTPTYTPTPTPTPQTTRGEDLVITNISTTPASPIAGADYTVNITVKNQGTAATDLKAMSFTFYPDPVSPPTYTTSVTTSKITTLNLAAGQSTTVSMSGLRYSTPGAHTLWAIADQKNVVPETNENNNTTGPLQVQVVSGPTATPTPTSGPVTPTPTAAAGQADLMVTNVSTTPFNPSADQDFEISVTLLNMSGTTITKSFDLSFYYDRSTAPTLSDADSESQLVTQDIGPYQQITVKESHVEFDTTGMHNIWVYADTDADIAETNENNNVFGPYTMNVTAMNNSKSIFTSISAIDALLSLVRGFFSPNQTYAQQALPTYTTSFTYDPLSRLTSAIYPDTLKFDYAYNPIDNRTAMTVASSSGVMGTLNYSYDVDSKLTQRGTTNYTYDNNGNVSSMATPPNTTSFTFDLEDRLTAYTPATGSKTTYVYDGNNNRIGKTVGTATTRYVNDTSGDLSQVLAETNSANSITKSYVYGVGLISQGDTSASSRNYYLEDGQGNMRFVTDNAGNKIRTNEYDPYGNLRSANGQANVDMLFQGQQFDSESWMYYLRARYYDGSTGRFISRDPFAGRLINPQTQNPYAYSLNNPTNISDPKGEMGQVIAAGAGTGAAIGGPAGAAVGACGVVVVVAYAAVPEFRNSVNSGIVGAGTVLYNAAKGVSEDVVEAAKRVMNDPDTSPGPEWRWSGPRDKGSWVKGDKSQGTQETLHNDPNNPAHPPHVDHVDPAKNQSRIYPDGQVEPK